MSKQNYSSKEIYLDKLKNYCAYQERCQYEVIQKMKELKIDYEWQDDILLRLISEKFVDEERFARAIVRGKFRINNWGKNKIRNFLFQKNIVNNLIEMALVEINEEEYKEKITFLIDKKRAELANLDDHIQYMKLTNYMLQKGYEANYIQDSLER
ncbi:MAG: RecX family transcriptional regulator [Saprospiraceae bacterium]|nr:RecX family transcriptional regulator [Saprospiraceae bacterium]